MPSSRPILEPGKENLVRDDGDVLDFGDRAEAIEHEVDDGPGPDRKEMLRPAASDASQPRGPARSQYECLHARMVRPNPPSHPYTREVSASRLKVWTP